jgi:hypothetical protein
MLCWPLKINFEIYTLRTDNTMVRGFFSGRMTSWTAGCAWLLLGIAELLKMFVDPATWSSRASAGKWHVNKQTG